MTKDEAKKLLRENFDSIKNFGVKRIGFFGSVSRNEANSESDVDIYVEFEEGKATLDNYLNLSDYLEKLFGRPVDLLTKYSLETMRVKSVKEKIAKDLIYV